MSKSGKKDSTNVHFVSGGKDATPEYAKCAVANDGAVGGVLDANSHKRRKVSRRKSSLDAKGKDDEEVASGDADVIVDQNNPSKDESSADDALASVQMMMERNPMRNCSSRSVSENAQNCTYLARKFWELKQSRPDEIRPNLALDVGSYMIEAARNLGNAEVKSVDEKNLVKVAQISMRDCIRNFL